MVDIELLKNVLAGIRVCTSPAELCDCGQCPYVGTHCQDRLIENSGEVIDALLDKAVNGDCKHEE